jgi:hypothetical protein
MEAIEDFLSVIVQSFIMLAIPILVAAAVFWIRQRAAEVKERMSAEQWALLQ